MVSLKKTPKKLMAVLLSLLMLITVIPSGLSATVFAATNECLAIEINSVKVYFYGAETLEVKNNKVTYTGGDETISAICVDGSDEIDTTDVVTDIRSVEFTNDWLSNNQNGWIAVICDSSIELPSSEPNAEVDTEAPVINEDDITGNPTEWTKDNITLTVNASDNATGVVAYSLDKTNWQSENSFEISENNEYTFFAKDAVGNVSLGAAITVNKIDKEAPSVPSIVINPKTWTFGDIEVTVSSSDNQSSVEYSRDKVNWYDSGVFNITENGTYTFYVKDEAGNISENSEKITNKDIYNPEINRIFVEYEETTVSDETYISSNFEYTFKVDVSDVGLGVSKYGVSVGESNEIEWNDTGVFNLIGAEKYVFYAVDGADLECTYIYEKKLDNNEPDADVSLSTNQPTNKTIEFTVNAADNRNDSILQYKCDDGKWQTENIFYIEDSKEHTFYVKDDTIPANIAQVKAQASNYFSSYPKITEVKSSCDIWTNQPITFTVVAEMGAPNGANNQAEVVSYVIDPDLDASNPAADWNWQSENTFVISDSIMHSFYVIDEAGNISEAVCKTADNYDALEPNLIEDNPITFDQKNDNWFAKIANKLSFGRFFNERLVITVNAQDNPNEQHTSNASGIVSAIFEFIGVDGKIHDFTANEIGGEDSKKGTTIKFVVEGEELPKDFKGSANVILADAAGNIKTIMVTTYNSDMGEIDGDSQFNFMIENNAPTVDNVEASKTPVENIYKNDYSVNYRFSDKAGTYNSGIAMVKLEVNGEEVLFNDYQSFETYEEEISVKTDAENKTVNGVEIKNWNKGELTYSISVVDNAGNVSETNEVTYYFDQTAPEITGFEFSKADDGYYIDENSFDEVFEAVTAIEYGFYFKNTVEVTVTAEDKQNSIEAEETGVKSITVYLKDVDNNKLYTVKENGSEIVEISDLNEIATVETNDKLSFVVPKDFKGQIYVYATDNVDNSPISCRYITDNDVSSDGFVSPKGSIIETTDKHTQTSAIEFISVPKAQGTQNNSSNYFYKGDGNVQPDETMNYVKNVANNKVPLYNSDITFGVKVTDSYSGIREVSYTIIEGSKTTVKTVQIDNDGNFVEGNSEGWIINDSVKDINLVTEMTNNITVSGNYNDMVLLIELTDRAGNKSYDYYVFGIDKTAPSIEVEYDNNAGDTQSGTGTYFKADRTATITVSERNFNKENVKFIIKNAEGEAPTVKFVKDIKGTGNGDDTKHVFEVTYSNDGVYSFGMNYTDRAANSNSAIDYKNSLAPTNFVVDKTNPTISVSYDNNEAQNGKYFKAYRTATITIVEHNFDVNRVAITQTSALSGNAISNPSVSWVNSGDTHTGTINYNADGDYTFDITMTDKAGNKEDSVNYGSSVAAKDFTIDTTYSDIVKVDGIADKGVLGLENGDVYADAKINITINDVNLDNYNVKLTRSRVIVTGESDEKEDVSQESIIDNPETQAESGVDVTSKFVSNASGSANATAVISIPKRDENGVKNDGLYTLIIEAKDKAGNEYDTDANIITFSVNRFGSVFTFSNDLYKLLNNNDGYTKSVESTDLTVYEYNATAINNETVEVIANNESKTLIKNDNYTVNTDNQQDAGSWSKNTYKIKPENFKNDGVYTLRISSNDASSITSQTVDYDVCSATFRVDSTPADIISVNYSTEVEKMLIGDAASAKTDKLTVNFTVEDLIRLEKVEVYINDTLDKTYTYGKDFDDANTFAGGQFVISDGGAKTQSFKIVVTDKAGNVIDTSNKEQYKPGYVFFDQLVVSPNTFAQFYANKALFFGSIGGVALAAGIIIFVVVRKRKNNDE